MSVDIGQACEIAQDHEKIADLIGVPFADWKLNCHTVSLKILRSGMFGEGRLARGWALHVAGQHSWIVGGQDVYDPEAAVVDPVLWSYDSSVTGIWAGRNLTRHYPRGMGCVFDAEKPRSHDGRVIRLTPSEPLSEGASAFLSLIEPLDRRGWLMVTQLPLQGWPAGEILAAMDDTEELKALVPEDALGMTTDRNPGDLYWLAPAC